ncbi:MAG: ABC transporter substrate-binding protein, partial [Acidimicrobiales bacterium]
MMGAHNRTRGVPRRWGVVLAVLVLVLASCSGNDDDAAVEEGPTTISPARTTLRVGVEEWPECLNPITCDSPALREQILQHVLPVAFEVDEAGEYRPSPLLEDEPEVDIRADGMTIEYRLAAGARWDDGRPITSSDIRATWQAFVNTPGADATGYDSITSIDDADPRVAVVELSEPYGDWRTLVGGGVGWVLEADAFGGGTDLTGQFEDELPFSAAPYRLVEWDGETAVLAGVEEYWDPSRLPEVDQVRMTLVTVDELAQPAAFDLLVPAGRTDAPEGFSTRRLPGTEVLGVWFDQRTSVLANVTHRRALSAMIDREVLIGEATDEDR